MRCPLLVDSRMELYIGRASVVYSTSLVTGSQHREVLCTSIDRLSGSAVCALCSVTWFIARTCLLVLCPHAFDVVHCVLYHDSRAFLGGCFVSRVCVSMYLPLACCCIPAVCVVCIRMT